MNGYNGLTKVGSSDLHDTMIACTASGWISMTWCNPYIEDSK